VSLPDEIGKLVNLRKLKRVNHLFGLYFIGLWAAALMA
jgi:hypothetical protein